MRATRLPVIVKRYGGERLYDASSLRYVSKDELRRWAAAKIPVRVTDAKTGEDITPTLLANT